MNTNDFGSLFDKLCTQSGKSNVQIANDLDVDKATIGRWRKGERSPKLSKLNDIANYFNVDVQIFASSQITNHQSNFTNPQEAIEFILRQPMIANFGGYDLERMSDEEIMEMAEEVSEMLKIMAKRHRTK